jgi:hypothetical protein
MTNYQGFALVVIALIAFTRRRAESKKAVTS